MTVSRAGQWLDTLQACCTQVGTRYLYLIIDQAGSEEPLLASVRDVHPPLRWHSLFNGLPENDAEELAPLLVCVDLHTPLQQHWLSGLMSVLQGQDMLLALVSRWRLDELAEHLSACLHASQGGCGGLLRFYDPRLFPVLFSHVLDGEQQQRWLQPAVIWSWLDRDARPCHLKGTALAFDPDAWLPPLELDDQQVETLDCASDAILAMEELQDLLPAGWSNERRFQACHAAMLKATEQGVLLDSQRVGFVQSTLSEDLSAPCSSQRSVLP